MGLFLSQRAKGQIFETRSGVDTLKWSERISVHANAVDWALLVPNIGVEFDVKGTNWNRWAVGAEFRSRWKTPSTFTRQTFYSIAEVRLYFRNYWRTRQIDRDFLPSHKGFVNRLFSCRRTKVRHPHTTYYRGLYASFSDISFSVGKSGGRQGKVMTAGVTYGIVRPLYVFGTGNSLDLDMGIDVGLAATHLEHFAVTDDECYVREKPAQWKIVPFPLPTQLRVGFVYRFGDYPITKKYRWRYDVDVKYQEALRDRILAEAKARRDKQNADSLNNLILNDFRHNYDSIAADAAKNRMLQEAAVKKAEAEKAKKAEEVKKTEEAKKAEEAKRTEEAKKAEEVKKAEETEKAEEVEKADEANKAEETKDVEETEKAEEVEKAEDGNDSTEQAESVSEENTDGEEPSDNSVEKSDDK